MRPWIMIMFLIACVGLLFASVATAGPCKGGACSTVEVQAQYEVTPAEKVAAAVGRSVGLAKKAVAVPVRLTAKILKVVKQREHKPVAKALKAAGRLICPRRERSCDARSQSPIEKGTCSVQNGTELEILERVCTYDLSIEFGRDLHRKANDAGMSDFEYGMRAY